MRFLSCSAEPQLWQEAHVLAQAPLETLIGLTSGENMICYKEIYIRNIRNKYKEI